MRLPIRKRYQLHLDTGQTLEGVVLGRRGGAYRLVDSRVELNGELVEPEGVIEHRVPIGRVLFATEVVVAS